MAFPLRPLLVSGVALAALNTLLRRLHHMDFDGKTMLIAGGSRGLGLMMARILCGSGARVALLARDGEELERAVTDLESRGGEARAFSCDLRSEIDVQQAIAEVISAFGEVNGLINNAGVIVSAPFEDQSNEDFEESLAIHFYAPLYTTRAILPHFREQGGGRILNISSIGGLIGVPHMASYSAGKFALAGFSQALTAELRRHHIRVTTAFPGLMRTGSHLHAQFRGQRAKEFSWFSTATATPLLTRSAAHCARHILDAFAAGRPRIVFPWHWRIASLGNELMPGLSARINQLINACLPNPAQELKEALTGAELEPAAKLPRAVLRGPRKAARSLNEIPPGVPSPQPSFPTHRPPP